MKRWLIFGVSLALAACRGYEIRPIKSIPSPDGKLVAVYYEEGGNSLSAANYVVRIKYSHEEGDLQAGCLAWRSYRAGPEEVEWNGNSELKLTLELSRAWQQVPVQQQDCLGVKTTVELVSPPPLKESLQKNR